MRSSSSAGRRAGLVFGRPERSARQASDSPSVRGFWLVATSAPVVLLDPHFELATLLPPQRRAVAHPLVAAPFKFLVLVVACHAAVELIHVADALGGLREALLLDRALAGGH